MDRCTKRADDSLVMPLENVTVPSGCGGKKRRRRMMSRVNMTLMHVQHRGAPRRTQFQGQLALTHEERRSWLEALARLMHFALLECHHHHHHRVATGARCRRLWVEHGQRRWEQARPTNHNRTHAGPAVVRCVTSGVENRFNTRN